MAGFDFASLTEPVSTEEPCGPDLDLEGDPDFLNFVARAEGLFPASYFKRDDDGRLQPFDRSTIDFLAEFKVLDRLLETTRDLRLLTIYGRLLALNRDIPGFASCIDAVATLVRDHWDDVNPKGEDGDYSLRGAVLQGFDDNPSVVLPLQHAPLLLSRRHGAISYRSIMVATGEAPPREDETAPDRGSIDRAFGEAELDTLKSTAADLRRILDAANTIQVTSIEHAGYEQAVSFDKLPALIKKMLESVDTAVAARDPSAAAALSSTALGEADTNGSPAAAPPVAVTSTVPSGRIATMADARDALAALNGYFRVSEPSSPAAILVQQAQRLMGKSFPEVVRILVPALADQAKIQIGSEKLFGLTFDQFPDPQEAWSGAGVDEPGADDGWSSSSWSEDAQVASEPERSDADASQPAIQATTRADAVSLLDQVSSFYRRAEPSSPIPLLTERARGMIERDFLAILKDVLPGLMSSRDD